MLPVFEVVLALSLAFVFVLNAYSAAILVRRAPAERRRAGASCHVRPLPRISVLVAAYREERCLPKCIEALAAMDYPSALLEILIITEACDPATTAVARALALRYEQIRVVNIVVAERGGARGKPRALNQGLRHATGDIIGVIDAEDIVDPSLCHSVVDAVAEGYDAVQGILEMANDYDGWRSLQFRAEYGLWFRLYLPRLAVAGYPVPFGGTTNFFTRAALALLDGWDARNLTEDFDIGMRAYARGLRVATIQCVTREESPTTFAGWLRQRTRWQRGKLQTFIRVLREPEGGARRRLHLILTCLAPHVSVFNVVSVVASVYVVEFGGHLPELYWHFALLAFVWTIALCVMHAAGYLAATAGERIPHRRWRAAWCGSTAPVYWILQWLAELRAIRQEFLEVSLFWEKTEHELRHVVAPEVRARRASAADVP